MDKIELMQLKDIETYLNRQQPEFFQFAMVLTADEDVSEKIILDSEYLFMAEERDEVASQIQEKRENPGAFLRYSKRFILSSIFRIARKNDLFHPPQGGRLEQNSYWLLPMDQRAVLCLRHKLKFSKDEITEILNLTSVEYFNLLNLARESILRNVGSLNSNIGETYSAY